MSAPSISGGRGLWKRLKDSDFSAKDNHYFVEIWKESPSSEATFIHGELREDEISEWVAQRPCNPIPSAVSPASGSDTNAHLVLRLHIFHPAAPGASLLPVPISRQTFEVMEKAWNLPSDFMESMRSIIPIATNYMHPDSDPKMIGLTIRSVNSVHWHSCLTMNFNRISGTTTGILCGLSRKEIHIFIAVLADRKEDASDPLLFPVMTVRFLALSLGRVMRGVAFAIQMLEEEIGMVDEMGKAMEVAKTTQSTLDLDQITRNLTYKIRDLSLLAHTFIELLKATNLIQATFDLNALHAMDVAFMKSLIVGSQNEEILIKRRLEAQMQIVFSLISQRDNKLNIEIAESSREISQASQRDSAAMKAIAEDSKRVALATQKDSASMRIIAAVTVVFLPGTFTATLFSASFFDFSSSGARVVSHWIWVYAVITLMLTAGVCSVWWISAAQREKDIDKLYGEEKFKTI